MTDIPHILGGRYEVGDLIGRGGMAQVHIGYDKRLSRTVAIKVLRSDLASDPTFLARFRREAQSAAALNHPAIVAVYDTGEETLISENGRSIALPYIVMEYVKGRTVANLLGRGQALPIDEAVQITVGVLSALEYSHYEGIVHRDIKPANIMISHDGKVKVMDFGIARAMTDSSATMTSTNSVVGTAQYLSPEQARGEVVDARSDLYSTGCLLYELLTGKPPFQGDSAVAVAYQHVSELPKLPSSIAPDIPDVLDRVAMKSLAKKREDRYQKAADMRSDLLAAIRGDAVTAPSIGVWEANINRTSDRAPAPTTINPIIPGQASTTSTFSSAPAESEAFVEEDTSTTNKKWLIGGIIAAVVLAISGLMFGIVYSGMLKDPSAEITMVEVPDMKNMTEDEVEEALTAAGLKMKVGDPVADPDIPTGEFLSSDPKVGESIQKGETVTVHFSSGPGEATIPEVEGLTQEEARKKLEEAGLSVGSVETKDEPGVEKNTAISTNPTAGSVVDLDENASVTLYVASGKVQLPSLIGMPIEEAQAALEALKLQSDTSQVESDQLIGTVVEQTPGEGTHSYDTRVKLTVSSGPAPETPETPSSETPQSSQEQNPSTPNEPANPEPTPENSTTGTTRDSN